MVLGPPATRTEGYLAAILDELRALRAVVEGGGPQGPAIAATLPVEDKTEPLSSTPADKPGTPTKRTRTRSAR